jgi:phospholipid/cholesterol/gamma-HCH transport system substrate-binding protein
VNYGLVGAFVLALAATAIAAVLWLVSGGAWQQQVDLYLAMSDESVAGLNVDAPVKFNGVDVGKVRDITLDPTNHERVRLTFAIRRGTPIKQDTVAVLKTQGLTGIAYVELDGGAIDSPPLRATPGEPHPVIRTEPSLGARLENVLASVLSKLDRTTSNIDAILSDQNRVAASAVLADVATLTRVLAARSRTIDKAIADAGLTMDRSARVSAQLPPLMASIGRTAQSLETMGQQAAAASLGAGRVVEAVGADAQRLGAETVPEVQRLLGELNALSVSLRRLSEEAERHPAAVLSGRSPVRPGPGESSNGAPSP